MTRPVPELPRLIGDLPRVAAKRFGSRTAIVAAERSYSFDQLDELSNRFANALIASGVAPGDHVGLLLHNIAEYPIAYFGIAKAGAVSVHLSHRFTEGELNYVLSKVPLTALIVESAMASQIDWAMRHVTAPRIIKVAAGQGDDASFAGLLANATAAAPAVVVDEDGASVILFTSGTTGYPKGAVQPNYGRCLSAYVTMAELQLTDHDVLAVITPLYHAAGLYTWFQSGIAAGVCSILLPAWDPVEFMETAERLRITGVFAVPTQLAMLARHPEFDASRLATLRLVVFGGAPSDPKLIAEIAHAIPQARLVQNYGQTETGSLVCQGPEERRVAPAALGRPNPALEIEIFAEPGRPAAVGELGEIATRGKHVMLGYYGDEEATRTFFRAGDEWGWTGDLAVKDEKGMFTLVGRGSDTIISGAVNIYPSELERIARQHPGVADCAAFGLPDPIWGELPAIAIVEKPGMSVPEADLLALFERTIARFKRPRHIFRVDTLPYTAAQKLKRRELVQMFAAAADERGQID